MEDAENLAQDVGVRWWKYGDRSSAPRASWIRLVLPQCAQAHLKAMRPHQDLTEEIAVESEPVLERTPEEELLVLLARLTGRQQQILKLHFWSGLTFEEIAQVEGTTPRAARHACDRAMDQLRMWRVTEFLPI